MIGDIYNAIRASREITALIPDENIYLHRAGLIPDVEFTQKEEDSYGDPYMVVFFQEEGLPVVTQKPFGHDTSGATEIASASFNVLVSSKDSSKVVGNLMAYIERAITSLNGTNGIETQVQTGITSDISHVEEQSLYHPYVMVIQFTVLWNKR